VPFIVPATTTETPGSGFPFWSVTLPLTEGCADAFPEKRNAESIDTIAALRKGDEKFDVAFIKECVIINNSVIDFSL